jgi:hypothetical protein
VYVLLFIYFLNLKKVNLVNNYLHSTRFYFLKCFTVTNNKLVTRLSICFSHKHSYYLPFLLLKEVLSMAVIVEVVLRLNAFGLINLEKRTISNNNRCE